MRMQQQTPYTAAGAQRAAYSSSSGGWGRAGNAWGRQLQDNTCTQNDCTCICLCRTLECATAIALLKSLSDNAWEVDDSSCHGFALCDCRIGVSRLSTDINNLGSINSWGYGSTGKKSTANIYSKYPSNSSEPSGRRFGPGDEVTCFLELSSDDSATQQQSNGCRSPGTAGSGFNHGSPAISFAVNGECLGLAFSLYQPLESEKALFPHVLVKNLRVLVKFRGERPLHWPRDKPWDGTWCGCLPWQVCSYIWRV
eukprot:GHUV01019320.1.p1 GENE.GHUV01019320.1~~GHUV01019320.1.p1  ORF type:complete len:254 (-),score=34.11 GHUV01019320.1:1484-2245(-)